MPELDDRLLDGLLDGTVTLDAVPPSLGPVAALIRAAQGPPSAEELAQESQIVMAMEQTVVDRPARRGVVVRALVAKAVAVVTLGGLGVAAAATTGAIAGLWIDPPPVPRPDREAPAITEPGLTVPAQPIRSREADVETGVVAGDPTADTTGCGPPADPLPADRAEPATVSSCAHDPPVSPTTPADNGPAASGVPPARADAGVVPPGAAPDTRPTPPDPPAGPPAQPGTPPGLSGTAPGQGAAPGLNGSTPGLSGTAPGQSGAPPGLSGTAPGQVGTTAPGRQGTTPGHSGAAPGTCGPAPGPGDCQP